MQENWKFPPEFLLLQQEGYVFRSCLCQGLTELRNANLNQKGLYYSAFFQLSIGLERLLKVIVIIDYVATHNLAFPTNDILKNKYRHDLARLVDTVRSIAVPRKEHPLSYLAPDGTPSRIVRFLSDFAKFSRYYNLDLLTQGSTTSDPLKEWNTILKSIIGFETRRLPSSSQAVSKASTDFLEGNGLLLAHNLEQQAISWQRWFEDGRTYELATSRATLHVLRLLEALKDVLYDVTGAAQAEDHRLGHDTPTVPFMEEFLSFVDADPKRALKKKRWP